MEARPCAAPGFHDLRQSARRDLADGPIDGLRKAGLEVIDCVEPPLEWEDLAALSGGLAGLAEEAFRSAWVGIPNALVWELVSRG